MRNLPPSPAFRHDLVRRRRGRAGRQIRPWTRRHAHGGLFSVFASVTPSKLAALVCSPWSNGLGCFFRLHGPAAEMLNGPPIANASQKLPDLAWDLSPAWAQAWQPRLPR